MSGKKSKNTSKKILFSTVFEHCRITDRRLKARTTETMFRYLDSYKKTGTIKNYTIVGDGVIISPKKLYDLYDEE